MITITHEQLIAACIAAAGLIAWLIAGMFWLRSREYARRATLDRETAARDLRLVKEERDKAELILEEAKRHGYRPDRRPASGKWGRLGYSDGRAEERGPVGHFGPSGPSGHQGWTGMSGPTGVTGPHGHGRTESEVILDMLAAQKEAQARQGKEMEERMVGLFKELMGPRGQERSDEF